MQSTNGKTTAVEHYANVNDDCKATDPAAPSPVHTAPETVPTGYNAYGNNDAKAAPEALPIDDGVERTTEGETTVEALEVGKGGWFAYMRTWNFWIVIVLG